MKMNFIRILISQLRLTIFRDILILWFFEPNHGIFMQLSTIKLPLSAQIFEPLGWVFIQEKRLIKALQYS